MDVERLGHYIEGTMVRVARFAWGLLLYDVGVAAWGTYVRATGSGAGCGRHWPLCNGQVVPIAPRIETIVELSHRLSSGGALVLTAALLVWSFRAFPRGHMVRRGAAAAMAFMVAEAAIGAALVLFELVAHDASSKRALSISLHLVNTFFLLAATALTAWWASGFEPIRIRGQGVVVWTTGAPLVATLFVGISGALTALGDTLFPAASIGSGIVQDFSATAHFLVRLRAVHPLFAAATAILIVVAGSATRARRPSRSVRLLSRATTLLVVGEVSAGIVNLVMLAPVFLQITHLVIAQLLWIALILLSSASLAEPSLRPRLALGGMHAAHEGASAKPS